MRDFIKLVIINMTYGNMESYGKLSTKLLVLAANKILNSCLRNWTVAFFLNMVSKVTVRKNSQQTFPKCKFKKSNCQETPYMILDSYF